MFLAHQSLRVSASLRRAQVCSVCGDLLAVWTHFVSQCFTTVTMSKHLQCAKLLHENIGLKNVKYRFFLKKKKSIHFIQHP